MILLFHTSDLRLHTSYFVPMKSDLCHYCRRKITSRFLKVGSYRLHPQCFICKRCKKVIQGRYSGDSKKYYHPACYQEEAGLICYSCGKILGASWKVYQDKKYHPSCLLFCSACERIASKQTTRGAYQYTDGRIICGLCKKLAVNKPWSINKIKRQLLTGLEKLGFEKIPLNFDLSLVDKQTITRHSRAHHTQGLTVTEKTYSKKGGTQLKHHILILNGLPEVLFKGVFAHEILHIWQQEHGFNLRQKYTEGLCNLGSFWVYKNDKTELGKLLLKKLIESEDKIYGVGFRLMLKKFENKEWKPFIAELLQNKHGFEQSLWKKIFG